MIRVEITPTSLSVTGHARAAPYGQDIVCAGVSALVQTFSAAAGAFAGDALEASEKPGEARYSWAGEPSAELALLVDSLCLGLCRMADSYPEYVTVTCTR